MVDHILTVKHRDKVQLRRDNYAIFIPKSSGTPSVSCSITCKQSYETKHLFLLNDSISNLEGMVLGTLAELRLSFTIAPVLVDLSKAMSRDPKALGSMNLSRTAASYKMQHRLAKIFMDETLNDIQTVKFSLNMDESTSTNLQRVLTILVSYFKGREVVVKHLTSFSLHKVDSE